MCCISFRRSAMSYISGIAHLPLTSPSCRRRLRRWQYPPSRYRHRRNADRSRQCLRRGDTGRYSGRVLCRSLGNVISHQSRPNSLSVNDASVLSRHSSRSSLMVLRGRPGCLLAFGAGGCGFGFRAGCALSIASRVQKAWAHDLHLRRRRVSLPSKRLSVTAVLLLHLTHIIGQFSRKFCVTPPV